MIRTAAQYIKSLNDGRVVYMHGERVPDVTKHPILRRNMRASATDWVMANDPKYRDLFTTVVDGERVMFMFTQPKTVQDLLRRRDIYVMNHRIAKVGSTGIHAMGVDAMAGIGNVVPKIDKELGTHYAENVEAYRKHLWKDDPGVTGCITDVKGNRSLRPMAQVQHKDFYVRVKDRQKDGIVVSGAKIHIGSVPVSNEVIVYPTRAHREEDKECALVFATPLNVKGIAIIVQPAEHDIEDEVEAKWDWPITGRAGVGQTLITFEDVFVPWNMVFMCGEWQFSREMAWAFGLFHRLYGSCRTVAALEVKAGVAALMAEYNGLDKYQHIQEKLARLAMHAATCEILTTAACEHADKDPDTGTMIPNQIYTNLAKFKNADDCAYSSKLLADITGGLIATVPCYRDWANPEMRPLLEKYLAAKAGVPTEHRLKAIRLAHDITNGSHDTGSIHGEGSLMAQIIAVYAETDWARYKAAAKRAAGIPGWEEHPIFKGLPDYPPKV